MSDGFNEISQITYICVNFHEKPTDRNVTEEYWIYSNIPYSAYSVVLLLVLVLVLALLIVAIGGTACFNSNNAFSFSL